MFFEFVVFLFSIPNTPKHSLQSSANDHAIFNSPYCFALCLWTKPNHGLVLITTPLFISLCRHNLFRGSRYVLYYVYVFNHLFFFQVAPRTLSNPSAVDSDMFSYNASRADASGTENLRRIETKEHDRVFCLINS